LRGRWEWDRLDGQVGVGENGWQGGSGTDLMARWERDSLNARERGIVLMDRFASM